MAAGVAGIGPSRQDPLQAPSIRRNPAQRASSADGRGDGVYNAQGQVGSFAESKASGADAKRAPAPSNSTYNAQGQVGSFTESKPSGADATRAPAPSNSTYNAQGQVKTSEEAIQTEGVLSEEGDRERSSGGRSTKRRIDLFV